MRNVFFTCVITLTSLLFYADANGHELMDIPPIQPTKVEDFFQCSDEKIVSLVKIVDETVSRESYKNYSQKERICSWHPKFGRLIRIYFIEEIPMEKKVRHEFQVFWEIERDKIVIISDADVTGIGGFIDVVK